MPGAKRIQLVIFDWAGTTVDFGCFAPVSAFIEAFAHFQVPISVAQARAPMGLHKRDHVRAIARMPEIAKRWREVHGRDCSEADIQALYQQHFVPLQVAVAEQHSRVIPGLGECVGWLCGRGIKIGTSTGYFQAAADLVYRAAARQDYRPDHNVCAEEVPAGRPAPWMIFRNMEALGVYPPAAVVKVGDTVPDVKEGLNAGVWSIGVAVTSSGVGCTEEELGGLPAAARDEKVARARNQLAAAGAHFTIDSVADLPSILPEIEARLESGQKP